MELNGLVKWVKGCLVAGVISFIPGSHAISVTDAMILGTVSPGTPASEANEAEMVRFLAVNHNLGASGNIGNNPADPQIETYVLINGSAVPTALPVPVALGFKNNNGNHTVSIGETYEYVLAKYATDAVVYYIGNLDQSSGSITLPTIAPAGLHGGLSHTTFFNAPQTSVPDAGSTTALLGIALAGLAATNARRRRA